MSDYYSFTTEYGGADKLFRAILTIDKARVEQLKAGGVTLTENVKKTLLNGGGSLISNKPESRFWYLYLTDLENIGKEAFIYISRTFFEEAGKTPLYYSDALRGAILRLFSDADVFACIMECYDQKKINKKQAMQFFIRKNSVELLEICARYGWLKQASKRDEMIEYANKQKKTECAAWLLDYKNRTADLKAEQAKAEKKAARELNAKPDSALELGKLWSWKKGEDGGLIITSYKGDETEITIPAKIGNNIVTAIGDHALSYSARAANKSARLMIERIIVPNGIRAIGKEALWSPMNWEDYSQLREVVLPETLDIFTDRQAAETAPSFFGYKCLAVAVVPRTEYARFYCVKNSINYRFSDEDKNKVHIPLDEAIESDALYSAIIKGDEEKYKELKKSGAVITDHIRDALLREHKYGEILLDVQEDFLNSIFLGPPNKIKRFILSALKAELGEPLYYDRYFRFLPGMTTEYFDRLLEYFNTKFPDKTKEMREFVLYERTDLLSICEKHGWLKNPATRDKLIQYAIDKHKTEATAWLLDFKNRTADFEAERKRAEKRLERQLNAPPPTPEELRERADKLFKRNYTYELENGEVTITGYKGKDVEVEIPREFEGKPITTIGELAFSPGARGVPKEHRLRRESIVKVVIPDTIRAIESSAFSFCNNLQEVTLPASVTDIDTDAFRTFSTITFIVERGSLAEEYCKANNRNYRYTSEE